MTDAAQKIAERVPLPDFGKLLQLGEQGSLEEMVSAYGLAVAAEALRGAEAVARKLEVAMRVLKYAYGNTSGKLHDEVAKAIDEIGAVSGAPPAGSVEVTDATDADIEAWLERHGLTNAIRGTDARAAFEDAQTWSPLTAALQEPEA